MPSLYEIALTLIPGVGVVTARNLLEHYGDAGSVFKATHSSLIRIPGIGARTASHILSRECQERAEHELAFVEKYHIKTLFFTSDDYPRRLRNCYDAPVLLYYKGNADLNASKIISIVGTRNATSYGKEITEQLIKDLSMPGILIVSGLAYGIDAAAHRGALKYDVPTVGVVGHGLDRIYPSQHRSLAEKMLSKGGILTEFPSGTKPDRENFPRRNRIVAGLADATLVVEAAVNGGALITADLANSYNRDVFAFPGRINDRYSGGCNYLIKSNGAQLVTEANDILEMMEWKRPEDANVRKQLSLDLVLSKEEQQLVEILKQQEKVPVDELSRALDIPISKLSATLLSLEMQGIIVTLPGKLYSLV